jgi:pimeloyl-ACP methyl ester carboxylesterase
MRASRLLRSTARIVGTTLVIVVLAVVVLRLTGLPGSLFFVPLAAPTPLPSRLEGEKVTFASRDGTKLTGWFLPAKEAGEEPGPAVLFVHGNAGSLPTHVGYADFLPASGLHVLLFDYRGYGESEGKAWWPEDLLADAHAALDFLKARPEVDPDRVAVYGHSLGGALGINLVAERPEVRAGAFVAAFADWRDEGASVLGGHPPGAPVRLLAWAILDDDLDPEDAIAKIDRPLLIMHGTQDAIVPYAHGERLARANPKAVFRPIEHADHNLWPVTHPGAKVEIATFLLEQTAVRRTPESR